jgi:hypothetical protein
VKKLVNELVEPPTIQKSNSKDKEILHQMFSEVGRGKPSVYLQGRRNIESEKHSLATHWLLHHIYRGRHTVRITMMCATLRNQFHKFFFLFFSFFLGGRVVALAFELRVSCYTATHPALFFFFFKK